MSRRTLTLIAASVLLALLLLGCNLPGAAPTATATIAPTATATATATPTPTATPAPADKLEEADWALFVGDWTRARELYVQADQIAVEAVDRGTAQFGLGVVELRAGNFATAEQELTSFLDGFPEHPRRADGYFLRGVARQEGGQPERAIADFTRYLDLRPGQIDAYVREDVGDMLRQLERPLEAIQQYQAALEAGSLDRSLALRVKVGLAYAEAEQYEQALARYDEIYASSTEATTRATANYLAGLALQELDRQQEANQRFLESIEQYPQAYDTYLGLIELLGAGVGVDDFRRGLIDYYAGAYEPALNAFNRVDNAGRASAAMYYYRGLSLRALGNSELAVLDLGVVAEFYPESDLWADAVFAKAVTEWAYLGRRADAVDTYQEFAEAAPEHPRAAEALFEAGEVADRMGDLALAETLWLRVVDGYPGSAVAHEAAFSVGIARYRQDRSGEARTSFEAVEQLTGDVRARSAAGLWIGKTLMAEGQEQMAVEAWNAAASLDPTGYYSERARDLAQSRAPFEQVGVPNFNVDEQADRAEAEQWLRTNFTVDGPEPLAELSPELRDDPRRVRGDEFWRLGLFSQARQEYESLRLSVEGDAEASYRLMHHMLDLGLYRPAIFAARHVLDLAGYDDAGTLDGPIYFNRIRFGTYFGDLILPAAAEEGFNPLLVLSVVRQESLFEGFVTSFASARGLMQVIPTTGQEIASELGWPPNYSQDDLYRPAVSVRFGTHYLAKQRALFEGDLVAALVAYNAGPGNALAWKELAPNDPDLFLEIVRFDEPKLYIERIYEIHSIYQDLYPIE